MITDTNTADSTNISPFKEPVLPVTTHLRATHLYIFSPTSLASALLRTNGGLYLIDDYNAGEIPSTPDGIEHQNDVLDIRAVYSRNEFIH